MRGRQHRREPVDVKDPARPDPRMAELGRLRQLRTASAEREQLARRAAWRTARAALHAAVAAWRAGEARTMRDWQDARAAFFAMRCSGGQFRAAKAAYERGRREGAVARAAAQEQVGACRADGRRYFAAGEEVRRARKRQEKLRILDGELRRLLAQVED
ncbi:hypothetical protein ACFOHT_05675 [Massilia oculi]|uniref:Uncharacterized protein n=1 Tax=Massilia oculi TaxID=945844 RepID=A0A2S2DDV4_9BURK|nr:hypothetical protein [Massilia oculi]AWL03531.1 hypothetical protein DIR46_03090 [Massilia oculi]